MTVFQRFVATNAAITRKLESFLPRHLRTDGNSHFKEHFVRKYLRTDQLIYDVGGGKHPFLTAAEKQKLRSSVIGLDISATELRMAPEGAYDETIVADITTFHGRENADLVISQAILEHVVDAPSAIAGMVSALKPGGRLLLFVPCRNAPFARLNLLLPETLKRRILFSIFPSARDSQGFVSHYNACTPSAVILIAQNAGMVVEEVQRYYMSAYFTFFVPLHILWRLWTMFALVTKAPDLCETFSVSLRKEEASPIRH